MDLDLVGYVLGSVEADERKRIDAAVRESPAVRRRLNRLRKVLSPLEAVRDDDGLPPGLAERTVAYVLSHAARLPHDGRPSPARRVEVPSDQPVFQPSRWRRADALVAACILVVLSGLAISGFSRMHFRHEIAVCQNNMRQLHMALTNYSEKHQGSFPQVQDQPPYNLAGAFIPILQDAGAFPAAGIPDCPAVIVVRNGPQPRVTYAYTLGYRDGQGRLHGLRRDDNPIGNDVIPILSDVPRPVNHRGGYNVLFIGGNVRFCTSPNVGVDGDDIFLNQASQVAAGLNRMDSVLAPGHTPP
jgi:hypothetical protein